MIDREWYKLVMVLLMFSIFGIVTTNILNIKEVNKEKEALAETYNKHVNDLIEENERLEERVKELETLLATEEKPKWTSVEPCNTNNSFKSYMDYRKITNTNSKQYALQQDASTNDDGFRVYGGRVMIAIANYEVGTELDLTLDDGSVIEVVVGDVKANTTCLHGDGSMIEFIVDTNTMSNEWLRLGDLNYVYEGNILKIKEYL